MHVTGKIIAGIVGFLAAATIIVLLSADALLNGVVKKRILHAADSQPGTSLSLGTFHYSIFANRISCDSLSLTVHGNHEAASADLRADMFSLSDVNWLRLLVGNGLSCGELAMRGIRGSVSPPRENATGSDSSSAGVSDRPVIPDALLPLSISRFSLDGGALARIVRAPGEATRDSVAWFQSEITNLHLDFDESDVVFSIDDMELEARRGAFRVPNSTYEVAFATALMSGRQSIVRVDSLRMAPVLPDETFFASSPMRLTRFRAQIPRFSIHGINLQGFLHGEEYTAQLVDVERPSGGIVVDMRKEPDPGAAPMPNEILAGMREELRIDSLKVDRGTIEYGELYPYSAAPAVLRWTDVHLSAGKISNRAAGTDSSPVRIAASARFQKTARMDVVMLLPLAKADFSLVCRGAVHSLPLTELNSFLEIAEKTRVVSGQADSIGFAFSAENGRATGRVHPLYRDLRIEVLAERTGRSEGFPQRLATLLANMFKIKKENVPNRKEPASEGPIQYVRKPGDPFFKFVWFSLRGGLGSVVGFSG